MKEISTDIKDLLLFEPKKFIDHRGFFSETYNLSMMEKLKNVKFVQDNQSLSKQKYTFRGLHFQKPPYEQGKLIRVLNGKILDIVVDIRKSSSTFGQFRKFELSKDNWLQLYVPPGFAHGFLTLDDNTEVLYKVTNYYSPQNDLGINIFDKSLNIQLPVSKNHIILSDKDLTQPIL